MTSLTRVDSVIQMPPYRGLEEQEDPKKSITDEKVSAMTLVLQNQQAPVTVQHSYPVQRHTEWLSSREVRQIFKEGCTALAAAACASGGFMLLAYVLSKFEDL